MIKYLRQRMASWNSERKTRAILYALDARTLADIGVQRPPPGRFSWEDLGRAYPLNMMPAEHGYADANGERQRVPDRQAPALPQVAQRQTGVNGYVHLIVQATRPLVEAARQHRRTGAAR